MTIPKSKRKAKKAGAIGLDLRDPIAPQLAQHGHKTHKSKTAYKRRPKHPNQGEMS